MSYTDILSSTPKYEFKGVQDCLQIVEQAEEQGEGYMSSSPYVIFVIDERSFLNCFERFEESLLWKSWEFYDPSVNQVLVKTMESGVHAAGVIAFTEMFHGWKGPFDPNYPLCGASTKVWRGSSGKKKRGDCSWTPTHSGLDGKWPSIAVEVAWTEPPGKLYKDMKFWLTQSSGNVNIVLAVRIYKRGRISIEHWKMGARTPITVQKIEITRNPAPNCEKIQGSMQLSFEDIHMRPKGPTDTDFVISHGDMQNLASQVWEAQDRNL